MKPFRIQVVQEDMIQDITTAWETDNYLRVIELSNKFLSEYPANSSVIMLRGFSYFTHAFLSSHDKSQVDTNLIWRSIQDIRKALVIGVNKDLEGSAYYVLGKDYYLLSDEYLDASINYFIKAIDSGYEQDDMYQFLSMAYFTVGEKELAIESIKTGIKKYPNLSLYLKLIDMYIDLGDLDKAEDTILTSKDIARSDMEKLALDIRVARVELEKDNTDKAINLFSSIIETYPQSVEAHYYLGNVYEKIGDKSKARYEWRQAYKLSPYWEKVIMKLDQE